ncbi:MAG TPA: helix-hairpin-helix domain-containing protein [Solirubrobacterales bacterium]|nr:helix-hairpin-helix domain-containing protein [Solirubrobacterales bacterium]
MFGASRSQIAVYSAIAAVLVLVGVNSIRSTSGSGEPTGMESAAGTSHGPDSGGDSVRSGLSVSAEDSKLVIDVSGGVRHPGVYRLADGSRVIDAIRRAGGVVPRAMPGAINRAAKLADGQQVVVPVQMSAGSVGAPGPGGPVGAAGGAAGTEAPISLGSATAAQLEEIEGIGPVTASQIIEFRDSKGGLSSVDELDQVSGIGPVTMEALRSRLQP